MERLYFDLIPDEISVLILLKLKRFKNINNFLNLVKVSHSQYFRNLWIKWFNYDKHYFNEDKPLVMQLFREFIRLNKIGPKGIIGDIDTVKIDPSNYYLNFSNIINSSEGNVLYVYVKIDIRDLSIWPAKGRKARGNLNDTPWHGFDVINSYGVIIKKSDHNKRLKDLAKSNY